MKTKRATTLTIEIPHIPIPEIMNMVQDFASESKSSASDLVSRFKVFLGNRNNKNKFKNYLPIAILVVVGVLGLFFVGRFVVTAVSGGQTLGTSDGRVDIRPPRSVVSIDKTYNFPLLDDKGKEIAKLKFFVDDAELRDEIVLDGTKASPPKGTTYLIVTMKLTNESDNFMEMRVRNYIRLTANGKDELYAAGIHNDPVEVQPQSTKLTRLGFPIKDTDKDLILRIGDLKGKKELVPLKFD